MSNPNDQTMGVSVHSDGDGWATITIRHRVPIRVALDVVDVVNAVLAKEPSAPPATLKLVTDNTKD